MYMEDALDMPLRKVLEIIQNSVVSNTTYLGVPALKSPMDAWVYEEIIFERKPDVIIEIGVNIGGGALRLAHFCDTLNQGRVIGVDISLGRVPPVVRAHPRITLIEKDAVGAFGQVAALIKPHERILIIEDSAHTYDNTLGVLRTYSGLVKTGDYFIVEDSICWHGLDLGPRPGPYEAVEKFLTETDAFVLDRAREKFFITWNPKGYLKRVR
jgi:cephalosporin hydroxylase